MESYKQISIYLVVLQRPTPAGAWSPAFPDAAPISDAHSHLHRVEVQLSRAQGCKKWLTLATCLAKAVR